MKEIWRTYKPFPEYEVSNYGQVRYKETGRIRKIGKYKNWNCCRTVSLSKGKRIKGVSVSKMVATTFIGEQPAGLKLVHIDGDKQNCMWNNLKYVERHIFNAMSREAHRLREEKKIIELQKNCFYREEPEFNMEETMREIMAL